MPVILWPYFFPPEKPDGRCPSMLKRHAKYSHLFTWKRWPANYGKSNCIGWLEWKLRKHLKHAWLYFAFPLSWKFCCDYKGVWFSSLLLFLFHWLVITRKKLVDKNQSDNILHSEWNFCRHLLKPTPGSLEKNVSVVTFLQNYISLLLALSQHL